MLQLAAWLNLAAGAVAAIILIMNEEYVLALGFAIAALTAFAALRGLDEIVGKLEGVRYQAKASTLSLEDIRDLAKKRSA